MRFETLPPARAEGAVLAHAVRAGERMFKKGRVLTPADCDAFAAAGVAHVTVVRLEAGDVAEDVAAARVAACLIGENLRGGSAFTGRANLYAEKPGVLVLDQVLIDAANSVDEAVTVATLPAYAVVAPGEMVATVKIIPFAAPEKAVSAVMEILRRATALRVADFKPKRVALVSTQLPTTKNSVLDKTRAALEARLTPLGGTLISEARVAHDAADIAEALRRAPEADLVFVFGASAITDRHDVIPAGIEQAGGTVAHFGMPVDPGNLLLLGERNAKTVIGLPGCARSPKLNGFDFVLQRLFADVKVTGRDLMRMGVGGLLKEIPIRGQLRDAPPSALRAPRITAVVLAAGLSSRMGSNKLLAPVQGVALVRRTVEAVLKSEAKPVIVVTGHDEAKLQAALKGLDVRFVHNAAYGEGLATSLKTGIGAVPAECDGALVVLGDMPEVAPALMNRLVAAFSPADGRAICVAIRDGKRGNPVLWGRQFFTEMQSATGDTGAKHLIGLYDEMVCEVEAEDDAVLSDIDTPDALAALRARVQA